MKFIDRVDGFAKRIERLVSGSSSADPLYLTNRSLTQKIRTGVLIGTPVLVMGVFMYLALDKKFDHPASVETLAARAATAKAKDKPGEITAKVLPNLDHDYATEQSRDVEVVEALVSRSGERVLSGRLRNNSDRIIRQAEVIFDLTDEDGSQLGGVLVKVEDIPAKSTAPFKMTVPQAAARTALVRELHSR